MDADQISKDVSKSIHNQGTLPLSKRIKQDPTAPALSDSASQAETYSSEPDLSNMSIWQRICWIFAPSCPEMALEDCPFNCCVFLGLMKRSSSRQSYDPISEYQRSLKYQTSSSSMNSEGRATASTLDEIRNGYDSKDNSPDLSNSKKQLANTEQPLTGACTPV